MSKIEIPKFDFCVKIKKYPVFDFLVFLSFRATVWNDKVRKMNKVSLALSLCRWFTVKEDEGRTLWLDTQSHASSSASSADDDYAWQWPTSFWSQFKVSTTLQTFPAVRRWNCAALNVHATCSYSTDIDIGAFVTRNQWNIRGKRKEEFFKDWPIIIS